MIQVGNTLELNISGNTSSFPYGRADGRTVYIVVGGSGLKPGQDVPVMILDRTQGGSNYLAKRMR